MLILFTELKRIRIIYRNTNRTFYTFILLKLEENIRHFINVIFSKKILCIIFRVYTKKVLKYIFICELVFRVYYYDEVQQTKKAKSLFFNLAETWILKFSSSFPLLPRIRRNCIKRNYINDLF